MADNLHVVHIGDSLLADLYNIAPGEASMLPAYEAQYDWADLSSMAQGGLALITTDNTGAFWNKDTDEPTANYTDKYANVGNRNLVQVVFLSLGTNAVSLTADSPTVWKAAYASLIARIKADFPRLRAIVPLILGNNTGYGDPAQWQAAKETMIEALDTDPIIVRGPEVYDLPMRVDGIHPDATGAATQAARMANIALGALGKVTPITGPRVSAASYSGTSVTLTVTHGGGSSLSGSEVDVFRVEDDGAAATINSLAIDGNTITLTLSAAIAAGSDVKLWVNYGAGAGVTNADIVRDNNGYPLQTDYEIDVVEG